MYEYNIQDVQNNIEDDIEEGSEFIFPWHSNVFYQSNVLFLCGLAQLCVCGRGDVSQFKINFKI